MAARFSTGHVKSALDNMIADYLYSVIEIYGTPSSVQPSDADDTEVTSGGVLLGIITLAKAAVSTPMTIANGLVWERTLDTVVNVKPTAAVWSGDGIATGTAVWFRSYNAAYVKGASTTPFADMRFDGSCGTSGHQLNLNSLSIVTGGEILVVSANYTIPKKA